MKLKWMAASRIEDGFTLVEVIITIVIMSILVAIAVIKYIDVMDTARTATCKMNQVQLESAQTLFYTDHYVKDEAPDYASSMEQLMPYLREPNIPVCPLGFHYQILTQGRIACPKASHSRR